MALLLRIRSSDGQNLTMVCSSSAVSAVSSEEVKAENTRKSYDHETALEEFKEAKDDTLGTRPGQPPETVRGSVDSVGVPEQSSAGRSGAPSEDGDPGGSSEHFERPAYNSRQEPGERPGEASVISPDSGWISGAQVESGNANSGRESRDVSWASLRRTTPHANGWRTLLFDATAGVAGRLTDVGLVCNVGGLLNERNLEGVWETMKAHTEDAWVYRERETQNGGEPAEDERGPSGPDERTVEDGSEQHSEGRKESNTTRGLLTDRASESLQLGEKQSSMGSNLGRRMLRGTGRDVESHEEIASFADGRAEVHSQDHAVTEEINGFRIQLGRIALQYEKEY